MPKVKPGESRSDYVSRCVRTVMDEGLTREQAVGRCEGMYDSHLEKSMDADPLGSVLRRVEKAAYEEGHISHRKDGDFQKRGGRWVRLPAQGEPRGAQEPGGPSAGAPPAPAAGGHKAQGLLDAINGLGDDDFVTLTDALREEGFDFDELDGQELLDGLAGLSPETQNAILEFYDRKVGDGDVGTDEPSEEEMADSTELDLMEDDLENEEPDFDEDEPTFESFVDSFDDAWNQMEASSDEGDVAFQTGNYRFTKNDMDLIAKIRPDKDNPEEYDADDLLQVVDDLGGDSDDDEDVAAVEEAYYYLEEQGGASEPPQLTHQDLRSMADEMEAKERDDRLGEAMANAQSAYDQALGLAPAPSPDEYRSMSDEDRKRLLNEREDKTGEYLDKETADLQAFNERHRKRLGLASAEGSIKPAISPDEYKSMSREDRIKYLNEREDETGNYLDKEIADLQAFNEKHRKRLGLASAGGAEEAPESGSSSRPPAGGPKVSVEEVARMTPGARKRLRESDPDSWNAWSEKQKADMAEYRKANPGRPSEVKITKPTVASLPTDMAHSAGHLAPREEQPGFKSDGGRGMHFDPKTGLPVLDRKRKAQKSTVSPDPFQDDYLAGEKVGKSQACDKEDLLGSVLGNVGRGVAKEDDEQYEDEASEDAEFDLEMLAAGEREELEHGDADEAHEIAEDHLREDPDYYLKLDDAGLMDDPLGQALARMESKE